MSTDANSRSRPPERASRHRVTHAVFPVAGLGETFLPATKACPKEMLPIVDRPLIQYAVEEAAAAGFTRIILVTGRHKRAIEDHFDRAYELEHELAARESAAALRDLRSAVPRGVTFSYVRQPEASGLPDALRKARPLIGDKPFAVILPDDLIDAARPALAQLLDVFDEQQVSVVGAQRSAPDPTDGAHFIAADLNTSALPSARTLVKVPPIGAASKPLALCGRYIFTPEVWNVLDDGADPTLARTVHALMERTRVFACVVQGRRFDCASKLGFLEAQFAFAQKRRELWAGLQRSLGDLLADNAASRARLAATAPATDQAAIMR
ncbi:MAG TPA: UTP--glucose-1-phosphate uridylyltransferase [Casimicrobiaceae bacterium]|jgi:UTP--glucose-1-phosphate uridylyltransferase